ncbi:GtrA family protein [Neobacillus kokaensis]|uniref:GtrA family protein n=1 Tax=Neobacillus kokaensis TaxID=2759023 RepID=UPI00174BB97A|nr:GtrA family protein [Neobacillus kokaensis]
MFILKYLKPVNNDFIRFLLVGTVNTFVGLAIMFFLLNVLGISYWVSTFTGNTVGACVSYLLNRSFTFRSSVSLQKGLPRFCAIIFICYFSAYFCSEKILQAAGHLFPLDQSFIQNSSILLGSGLYTLSNYLGQKYIVFKKITPA